MKKRRSCIALLLVWSMLLLLTACGGTAVSDASSAPAETIAETSAPSEAPKPEENQESESTVMSTEEMAPEPELEYTLPIHDDSISISYWISWNPDLSAVCAPGDASVYKALEERTGIHVDYRESSPFNQGQDFDLMIASGDYVDIFPASSNLSPDQAFEQDICIDLTGYMDTYLRNYHAILKSNDEYMHTAVNDEGQILSVNSMYDENVAVNFGLVIRKDWLDQLGLDMPETYDDYHKVLTTFKNQLGANAAMHMGSSGVLTGNYFCSGFGINGYVSMMDAPFYQVDGEVKFGPIQPEFKDYLTMMNQWYSEGLIYKDFYSVADPMTAPSDQITTDNMGLWVCELARMHEFDSMFDSSSTFEIWPVQDAVQNRGDVNKIRVATEMATSGGEVIASTCAYPEIAALWLDYRYTDEGRLLLNYGVEGEGFEYVDGEPQLTELITGAENINFGLAMYATVFLGYNEPERMWSTYSDAQMASLDIWKMGDNEYGYSANAIMNTQEQETFSRAYSDINTYLLAEIVRFVIGDRSLDEFDDYVADVEAMGIDACIECKQAALDRYLE